MMRGVIEYLSAVFDVRHSNSGFGLRVNEGGNTSGQVIYCNPQQNGP
jgi:hypothetical protein